MAMPGCWLGGRNCWLESVGDGVALFEPCCRCWKLFGSGCPGCWLLGKPPPGKLFTCWGVCDRDRLLWRFEGGCRGELTAPPLSSRGRFDGTSCWGVYGKLEGVCDRAGLNCWLLNCGFDVLFSMEGSKAPSDGKPLESLCTGQPFMVSAAQVTLATGC